MPELEQNTARLGDYRMQRDAGLSIPDLPDAIRGPLLQTNQPAGNGAAQPQTQPLQYEHGNVAAPGGGYYAPGFVGGGLSDTGTPPPSNTGQPDGGGLGSARVGELGSRAGRDGDDRGRGTRAPAVSEMGIGDLAQGIADADLGISAFDEALGEGNPVSAAVGFARGQQVTQLDKLTSAPDYVNAKADAMGLGGGGGGELGTSTGDPTASMGGGRAGGVGTPGVGGGFGGDGGGGLGKGESPSEAAGTPFKDGGLVRGPGDGNDDAVRARLSNGEFIIQQPAVAALGEDVLAALNDPAVAARVGPIVRQEIMGGQYPAPAQNGSGLRNARAGGY